MNQKNTVAHHWGVLDLLSVERIDHGVNILDDPKLIETVRARRIGITVCVTELYSNVPGRIAQRSAAVKRMLDLGLLATVNSDDPGIMRSNYVADCLKLTQQAANLSRDEVITLVRTGFVIAWLNDTDRAGYLKQVDDFLTTVGDR